MKENTTYLPWECKNIRVAIIGDLILDEYRSAASDYMQRLQ